MDFCKAFNAKTAKQEGLIIPVVVTVYSDRTYSFVTKTPPAAILLKKAANIAKGSAEPNKTKVGKVTMKQVREIAQTKMPDLNASNLDAAVRIVLGTARSMGMEVVEADGIKPGMDRSGSCNQWSRPDRGDAMPKAGKNYQESGRCA